MALSIFILFAPFTLVAQSTNLILDPVIVTANRSESSLLRSGVAITVIGSREISNMGYVKPVEFLRMVPGVSIAQNGTMGGGLSSVFIRGAKSEQMLLMIDGVLQNDPSSLGRSATFESLNMSAVDRIEVLRGSQGAIYGSDAMGGIIQLISRPRSQGMFKPVFSFEYGSFNSIHLSLVLRGSLDLGEYDFTGAFESTAGASKAQEPIGGTNLFQPNPYTNLSIGGRVKWVPEKGMSFTLAGRLVQSATSIDGGSFSDSTNKNTDGVNGYGSMEWQHQASEKISYQMGYALSRSVMTNIDTSPFGYNNLLSGINHGAHILGHIRAGVHLLNFGVDGRVEFMDSVSANSTLKDANAKMLGTFGQGLFDFDSMTLEISGRGEWHERFGLTGTFHGGVSYQTPIGLRLSASGGRSFKAPSLYQLFDPTYGQSKLQPEVGYTADLTAGWVLTNRARISVTGFYHNFSQQIDWVSTGFFSGTYSNRSGAQMIGLEVEGRMTPVKEMAFGFQYSMLDARDSSTGAFLDRRAVHTAAFYGDAKIANRLQLGLTASVIGNRYDVGYDASYNPFRVLLDPYVKLDARVAFDILPNLSVYVRGENLLDQKVSPLYGYKNPGVLFFGGLSFGL